LEKKIKKNALDISRAIFKDESITIDIVSQLNFFLDVSKECRAFLQKTQFAKTRRELVLLCYAPF